LRTEAINLSLVRTITEARLDKYLIEMKGDLDAALNLYEYNIAVSEAFYTPLQNLEICLRNTIDGCMRNVYGPDWFHNGNANLTIDAQNEVLAAYHDLGDNEDLPPGSIIAELKFSFWVGLLAQKYDATLWRKALYAGFNKTTGKKRSDVHGRFNAIRRFRNRVAHHEPIFHKDLPQVYGEIIEAIGWMCPHTKKWTEHHSRVFSVLR
jgi:Abi-like protein